MSVVSEHVSSKIVEDLPNLKIEIENDLDQKMDTDDGSTNKAGTVSSDTEEGELVDEDDTLSHLNLNKPNSLTTLSLQNVPSGRSILKYDTKEYIELQNQASVKNPNGAFVTGVNIFSPEEQAKLDKRAQRFGIEASDAKVLTEKLLKKLYRSMCVKPTDKNIRVEALHMRGTEEMTTEDVFDYFKDYGPASLEWITDNSCNVVWLDDISAARALLGLSLHISGQTYTKQLSQSDSDPEMESQAVQDNSNCLSEESDSVDADTLGLELPPGLWRRGANHPLSSCILLRFATTNDRSQPKLGLNKFGNHQFRGYVGLISESRKRRMLGAPPSTFVFDDIGDENIPKPATEKTDNVNPWGVLAKTWSQFDRARQPKPPSPIVERIIPLSSRMTPPPSPPFFPSRPKLIARTRRRRERDERAKVNYSEDEYSDNEEWRSRSKIPRMRMHADDEERKLVKRLTKSRRNRSLSFSPTRRNDLRQRIHVHRYNSESDKSVAAESVIEEPEDEIPDLRVAVAADKSPTPEDSKAGIQQLLFQSGNVKSVLRGARGHNENDDEGNSCNESKKSHDRRHRSRSKERRKHHRKNRKDYSKHKSRRRVEESESDSDGRTTKAVKSKKRIEESESDSDQRTPKDVKNKKRVEESDSNSDERSPKAVKNRRVEESESESDERTPKAVKSTIRKISPEKKESLMKETRERGRLHGSNEKRRSHDSSERRRERSHDRRRRDQYKFRDHKRYRIFDLYGKHHGHSEESRIDLRSKLAHKHKTYDSNNEFRSKSPLQIEIDNVEYFKNVKSDEG